MVFLGNILTELLLHQLHSIKLVTTQSELPSNSSMVL